MLWSLGTLLGCAQEFTISLHPPDAADAADPGDAPEAGVPDAASPDAGQTDAGPGDGGPPVEDSQTQPSPDATVPTPSHSLRVRYDFSGRGTAVVDRAGSSDAVVRGGAELSGEGTVVLDGEDDYIDMPNGLISDLSAITVMAWFEWAGGPCWQRLFDFGSSDQGEGNVGRVETSLFFTPLVCGRGGAAAFAEFGSVQYSMWMEAPLPTGRWLQVAFSVDPGADVMRLYVDGELRGEAPVEFSLDAIHDVNVWLGRSQWEQDLNWNGRYDEFRLYDRALTAHEVWTTYANGPDTP